MAATSLLALAVSCDSPVQPEADLGSTLDPDGLQPQASFHGEAFDVSSVVGIGWQDTDPGEARVLRRFTIAARDLDGRVSGEYEVVTRATNVRVRGEVTCLSVVDNRAFVGGTIEEASLPFPPEIVERLTGVAVEVVDNGRAGGVDEISVLGLFVDDPEGPQRFCDQAVPGPVGPIDRGRLQVR